MRGPFVLVAGVVIAYDSRRPPSLLAPAFERGFMRAAIHYCVV